MKATVFAIAILFLSFLGAQPDFEANNSGWLKSLFENKGSTLFKQILDRPDKYRFQIIYSQIDRNRRGVPFIKSHYYNFNKGQYFYPASLVKLPTSLLSLQKLTELDSFGIKPETPIFFDSAWYCQVRSGRDASQVSGWPNIDGFVKKMMVVSDNPSYNRMFEFLGYDYIANTLRNKEYFDTRIIQRFDFPCDSLSSYNTNPVYFFNEQDTLYYQPPQFAKQRLINPYGDVYMGSRYYDAFGNLYPFPRSFMFNNFLPINELHKMLISLYLPESLSYNRRWDIKAEYADLLKKYMGMWPRECRNPSYSYADHYKKYLLIGDGRGLPDSSDIRIFNVVGRSFGVLADCAYIVDFRNNVEFCVTAVIYCNEEDVLNSDRYQYETAGLPFLAELGQLLYHEELQREKQYPFSNNKLKALYSQ
ncbi:MAG: hypothetical protein EBV15_02570 [Bacteroidetes bacterium]|nr:hypothetical protein [Bacteroidota bacterium]